MRKLFLLLLCLPLFTACLEEECQETVTYQVFDPVYITANEWRATDFEYSPPEDICEPSGFYVYEDILFVVDRGAGIHLLDNTDNANPQPLHFLKVPGGQGIAVRNNILYINQYLDLLAFDLSNPRKPTFLSRAEDVFSPHTVFSNYSGGDSFIAGYEARNESREISCLAHVSGQQWFLEDDVLMIDTRLNFTTDFVSLASAAGSAGGSAETIGTGGSLARFTITNGTLFTVDDHSLRVFDLGDPARPDFLGTTDLGWGIETIFPQGNLLFIGSTTGVHIYDASVPTAPAHLSTFEHVRRCDPVVVEGDLAYVTMWGGSECGDLGDQLLVINVSDPTAPRQLQEMQIDNSHGLGIADGMLFLASAQDGIRVYELAESGLVGRLLRTETGFDANDVIALSRDKRLIVLGRGQAGVRQYDYNAAGRLTTKSHLAICD